MRYIKLVIFDLDGTLIDSLAELTAAINHVSGLFGLTQFSECEVRSLLAAGSQRLVEKAFPKAGPAELAEAYSAYLAYSEAHLLTSARIYPGVVDTLSELQRNGILMAIISNKHSRLSRSLLRRLGIEANFFAVIGPDSLPFRKPSPKSLLKLLDDLGMNAGEGVIVGDSVSDILTGRRTGVVTVGCSYGYGNAFELKNADYCISSLPELLKLPLFGNPLRGTIDEAESVHNPLKGLKM